jgi:hypothetical protein
LSSGTFKGRIGRYYDDSEPWWTPDVTAPAHAPNVVIVVLDDVGFSQFGCYGSDISTPTLDRLAAAGVRFTNFHTTAVCSATRARHDRPQSPFERMGRVIDPDGRGRGSGSLAVRREVVAEGDIPRFTPIRFSATGAGLTCGYSNGLPVSDEFEGPFRFTEELKSVTVTVEGEPRIDAEGEARLAIASQ